MKLRIEAILEYDTEEDGDIDLKKLANKIRDEGITPDDVKHIYKVRVIASSKTQSVFSYGEWYSKLMKERGVKEEKEEVE